MIGTNVLNFIRLYIEANEIRSYLVKACELLRVDSPVEELKLFPLKDAYLKGRKTLDGGEQF